MSGQKIWFVSYRLRSRPLRYGHARTSRTIDGEAEAKTFARTGSGEGIDITAGTINPHLPENFYGSAHITEWFADDAELAAPNGRQPIS
jgi:hypothetical protein